MPSDIHYMCFPHTEPPPAFMESVAAVFRDHEDAISTVRRAKGLTSDQVLAELRPDLLALGFEIEAGKEREHRIERPVFYGENGVPTLRYQIDAYHPEWRCGLEVEAGRGLLGNAIYRDLVQALVMVHVDHLVLAVANKYKYRSGSRVVSRPNYQETVAVAEALYGHSRMRLPYSLAIVGY
jgi:hypothetical protein